MKNGLKKTILLLLTLSMCTFLFAQNSSGVRISSLDSTVLPNTVLGDAFNAYKGGDYKSALFLFRKALSDRNNQNDNTLYMLIMAGMHAGEYKTAYADAEYFLESYPTSEYASLVKYQKGRALFYLKDYDKALIVLGDFCHGNPDNMMYPSALFFIGESFYLGYNFDKAESFYQRIVNEFPSDSKANDARYRLASINDKRREQKLLHMLQETGENYLSSREDYEKTVRRYELENSLERKVKTPSAVATDEKDFGYDIDLLRLKTSALEAEMLLNNGEGK